MRRAAVVAVVFALGAGAGALAVALAGDDSGGSAPAAAKPEPPRPRLVVTQRVVGQTYPIEGAISFLRLRGPGAMRYDARFSHQDFEVDYPVRIPGAFTLTSYQRTCGGNCAFLDRPSERCERTFRIAKGQVVRASITVDFARGCTIAIAP